MFQRTALRAASHHFHFRFYQLRNRLFGMFENHSPRILENRVLAGCFGDFCFALGYQIEHFQLRLHFQAVIF
jgi:hypothetical protein